MFDDEDFFRSGGGPTPLQIIFARLLGAKVRAEGFDRDEIWSKKIDEVFPGKRTVEDAVNLRYNSRGFHVLREAEDYYLKTEDFPKTCSFYTGDRPKRGIDSAKLLGGIRPAFNKTAEALELPLRLYSLGMNRKVYKYEFYDVFVDETPMPDPGRRWRDDGNRINKPNFLYLEGGYLAIVRRGDVTEEYNLWQVFHRIKQGFDALSNLQRTLYSGSGGSGN